MVNTSASVFFIVVLLGFLLLSKRCDIPSILYVIPSIFLPFFRFSPRFPAGKIALFRKAQPSW